MLQDTKAAISFAMRILWTIALGVILASLAFGQFQSTVEGSVQDTTQAAVPGADVTLVNESTQVTLRTTTNEGGFFRLPQLSPGTYRVEVRKGGFRSWLQ